ncbi:hypothetical protein T06_4603 [Trichinella sp. T6]|nr:hypothetical protein T06_4603 [Trichinella sp. T6]
MYIGCRSSQRCPHCNDPQGGAGGSASGSAPVCPPSLCDCSSSLAQSRLLVDILSRTSTRTTCLHIGHRSRSEKIEDSIYDSHMVI